MGLCTGLISACLTAATPSAPARMPTRRRTWSCRPSTRWGSGDAAPSPDAAPACRAGPIPTSPSLTRSTRTPKPVSDDSACDVSLQLCQECLFLPLHLNLPSGLCWGFFIKLSENTLLIAPCRGLLYCPTECLLINCWRSSYLFITATEIIKWL